MSSATGVDHHRMMNIRASPKKYQTPFCARVARPAPPAVASFLWRVFGNLTPACALTSKCCPLAAEISIDSAAESPSPLTFHCSTGPRRPASDRTETWLAEHARGVTNVPVPAPPRRTTWTSHTALYLLPPLCREWLAMWYKVSHSGGRTGPALPRLPAGRPMRCTAAGELSASRQLPTSLAHGPRRAQACKAWRGGRGGRSRRLDLSTCINLD